MDDRAVHNEKLQAIINWAQGDKQADLYGKNDVLPWNEWRLTGMSQNQEIVYEQMIKMME